MTIVKDKYVAEDGVSTLARPRYSPGLLLEDDDLTAAVEYTRNMMRLMFRSLFGCGVICGLDVTAQLTCNRRKVEVTVARGVALDCLGDPIEIPKSVKVVFDANCDTPPEWLWVVVCYVEKCCRPKDISCAPDEHGQIVQTRIMDGFEVRVYSQRPKCACSCEPPAEGTTTSKSDCCDDEDEVAAAPGAAQASAQQQKMDKLKMLVQQSAMTAQEKIDAELILGEPKDAAYPSPPAYGNLPGYPGQREIPKIPGQPAPEPPKLPDLCDCYQDHYDGKCDCKCCCPCVLIGKVNTKYTDHEEEIDLETSEPQGLYIDRQWVRWIRPVLTGYYKCVKAVQTVAGGQIVAGQQKPNVGSQNLRS